MIHAMLLECRLSVSHSIRWQIDALVVLELVSPFLPFIAVEKAPMIFKGMNLVRIRLMTVTLIKLMCKRTLVRVVKVMNMKILSIGLVPVVTLVCEVLPERLVYHQHLGYNLQGEGEE